jgi:hypothetical protein
MPELTIASMKTEIVKRRVDTDLSRDATSGVCLDLLFAL